MRRNVSGTRPGSQSRHRAGPMRADPMEVLTWSALRGSAYAEQVLSMLCSADFSLDCRRRPQWYFERIHILEYVQR